MKTNVNDGSTDRLTANYLSSFRASLNNDERFDLIMEFYTAFSRFEYTLKSKGITHSNEDAKVNWSSFEKKIEKNLSKQHSANNEVKRAVDIILSRPPKKQIITDSQYLSWRTTDDSKKTEVEKLTLYVRRVRNNLFHGGKFTGSDDTTRNWELLEAALIVISYWLENISDFKDEFFDTNT